MDALNNLLIKSKAAYEAVAAVNDHKLNYNKIYEDPKYEEVSYVDALADLEEVNELFKQKIDDKNRHYNFFLDDSVGPETPISTELLAQYRAEKEVFCYTTHNTWTKGKDFFFVPKGTVMKVTHFYDDRVFADLEYHSQVGLIKIAELKIIISNGTAE